MNIENRMEKSLAFLPMLYISMTNHTFLFHSAGEHDFNSHAVEVRRWILVIALIEFTIFSKELRRIPYYTIHAYNDIFRYFLRNPKQKNTSAVTISQYTRADWRRSFTWIFVPVASIINTSISACIRYTKHFNQAIVLVTKIAALVKTEILQDERTQDWDKSSWN